MKIPVSPDPRKLMGWLIKPDFNNIKFIGPNRDNICLMPMAETKGGATSGKRNALFQNFFPGIFIKDIVRESGIARMLVVIITIIARSILLVKLCLTAMFEHITGKRWIEIFVDCQNKNAMGYPAKARKNNRINKNKPFICFFQIQEYDRDLYLQ